MPEPTIITQIKSIDGPAVFSNYKASSDLPDFKKYNLIYGFNGSGKTTVTRLFRGLAKGSLCPATASTRFRIQLSDGSLVTETSLERLKEKVLVFNSDFIEENLSWKEGTANAIFYIGKQQKELIQRVENLQKELARFESEKKIAEKDFTSAKNTFETFKTDRARLIAEALNLGRKYNATHLSTDHRSLCPGNNFLLSDEDLEKEKTTFRQQDAKPIYPLLSFPGRTLTSSIDIGRTLLQKTLGSAVAEEVKTHPDMVEWLRQGVDYHSQKSMSSCLFCGATISENRWAELGNIIDDRYEELRNEIDRTSGLINEHIDELRAFLNQIASEQGLSKASQEGYTALTSDLREVASSHLTYLEDLAAKIKEKRNTPNITIYFPDVKSASHDDKFHEKLNAVNLILEKHNQDQNNLEERQRTAFMNIKGHLLAEEAEKFNSLLTQMEITTKKRDESFQNCKDTAAEIEECQQKLRQHGPAAETITNLIKHYLGHDELKIQTQEDGYIICRNGAAIEGPLSEGEKTTVALCYFISLLQADGRNPRDTIVVIDDPISSLDTRALNYSFSLIKAVFEGVAQLIVLTHNINFMNETKKWLRKKAKGEKPTAALFFLKGIECAETGRRSSVIVEMPKLLREYESEYHYLFSVAKSFAEPSDDSMKQLYMLPNILRKLLDIFLSFKVPGSEGLEGKLRTIANKDDKLDTAGVMALERLVQVESHSDNLDDLVGFSSMTVEETRRATTTLFTMIERLDSEHYRKMCRLCR